jgi:hypothetical protein
LDAISKDMWKRRLHNWFAAVYLYNWFLSSYLFFTIFFCIPAYAQELFDSTRTGKENILLSIFPEDCIKVYRLPENRVLKERIDSVENKFQVYTIGSRARPGLAKLLFDKLSEARIDGSIPYIALHVTFRWEGRGVPYSMDAEGEMNCDTLQGLFSREIVNRITHEKVLLLLQQNVFMQPLDDNTEENYNSPVIEGINILEEMYEADRDDRLFEITRQILKQKTDSFISARKDERNVRAGIRNKLLASLMEMQADTILICGLQSIYTKEGMSTHIKGSTNKDQEMVETSGILLDKLYTSDLIIQSINERLTEIDFLLHEGENQLHRQIKQEITNNGQKLIDFASGKSHYVASITEIIEKDINQYDLEELKQYLR